MDIISFIPEQTQRQTLQAAVFGKMSRDDNCEIYATVCDFLKRLSQPKQIACVVVLCPTGEACLKELLTQKDYFNNTDIIVVLPEKDKGLLEKSRLLHPRFITFADEDPKMLGSVLKKKSAYTRQQQKYDLRASKAIDSIK